MTGNRSWLGYRRADRRLGIRNNVLVIYLVECAHHVAQAIVQKADDPSIQLIGFPGCYPNAYAFGIMTQLAAHPNVGGAVIISPGCEGFDREGLAAAIAKTGRPVETLVIQKWGGTRTSIAEGLACVMRVKAKADTVEMAPMGIADLIVGTICGGSDGTSGITANQRSGNALICLSPRAQPVYSRKQVS